MTSLALLPDEELFPLFKGGSEAAYAEIYRRHVGLLLHFTEGKLYDLEDARDLIQELFTQLWHDRENITIDGTVRSWLFANARYRVIDHIRKNVVRENHAEKLRSLSPAFHSLEEELDARELQRRIQHKLSELPERTQLIYLDRENGKSVEEIARELELSDQTVRNQLSRALKHLRSSLTVLVGLFI